jgi:hypothetical protein
MASAFYFVGKKQKFGRGVGFAVNETDDFLWNQDNAYVDGGMPGGLWKAQIDHTFSSNFFMSAKAAYYDTGFGLFARIVGEGGVVRAIPAPATAEKSRIEGNSKPDR